MKTETDYTSDITKKLRVDLPNALVFKHADRFTTGIPDFSVSAYASRVSIWVEAKRIYKDKEIICCPSTWVDKKETLQLQNTVRLRGHFILYDPIHYQWGFLRAELVAQHYRDRSIIRPEHLVEGVDLISNHPHVWKLYEHMLCYLTKELS